MLNTPLGAALLFSLQRRGGALGLPEVIEKELAKVAGSLAVEAAQKYDDAASFLEDVGLHQVHGPPFDLDRIRERAVYRLEQLDPFLVRDQMSLAQARGALSRVIAEQPPNGPNNQQFKDSLVWEALIAWSDTFEVTFITGDKGFFEGRDFNRGLAAALRPEAERLGISVHPLVGLSGYLTEMSKGLTPVQDERLRQHILTSLMPRIEAAGDKWNFVVSDRLQYYTAVFLTRTSGTLAVQFSLTYEVRHRRKTSEEREGTYSIGGSASYVVDEDRLNDVVVDSETISLEQPSGKHLNEGTYRLPRDEPDEYIGPRLF